MKTIYKMTVEELQLLRGSCVNLSAEEMAIYNLLCAIIRIKIGAA